MDNLRIGTKVEHIGSNKGIGTITAISRGIGRNTLVTVRFDRCTSWFFSEELKIVEKPCAKPL